MKTLGIIGGIGPESTVDYYKLFISLYRKKKNDGSYPSFIINSIDMKKMLDLISDEKYLETADFMTREIRKIANAGADIGLISSNTPHIVFDLIKEKSPIPLISIVETACNYAKSLEIDKAGLLGTKFTMMGGFYQKIFLKNKIDVEIPDANDVEIIHNRYMNELVKGKFLSETKKYIFDVVDKLINEQNINCLILGGTELPLLLRESYYRGIEIIDTTRLHVEAAIEAVFS
jgi:aspartate racemase